MCSINEIEQAGDNIKSKKGKKRRDKKNSKHFADEGSCMKCPEKAVVLVRNNDPFCRTCFLEYVVHKFRATIGKARVIHQGQRVLLAVSGGSASSAMLDLVIKGLGKDAVRKHRFQPGVVHIDYEGLCGQSLDDRSDVKHHIEELVKSAGFPYHEATLADIFIPQEEETCIEPHLRKLHVSRNEGKIISNELSERSKRLKELFKEVTSVTAKEDLLLHLFRNLVQRIAKDHGYDYIMLGDCGSNIAVRILADVAQGRGSQLPYSVSFKDDRSEVPVLRPMREFTKKEIQFYNCFSQVTSFATPSFTTKASTHASIHRLTEELIVGLQAGFPSTVNTVLKTGDKISSNFDSKDGQHCALCLAPLGLLGGFSEVFSEPKTCGSDRCSSGGDCQKTDDDGGTCYQKGDGDGISCQKSDTKRGVIGTGNNEIDGGQQFCLKSDGSGMYGIDDGDDTLRGSGSHSDAPKSTSGGDSDMTGTLVSDGTSGHVSTCGDSLDGKLTGSSESDGTLTGSGGYSGTPDAHVWCDQNMDDHNVLVSSLCYGCKLTYRDIENGEMLLPKFVTENSRKQFERKTMKEQIQDFLIDD